ncbi:MAG: hypothetical protein K2X81_15375 [Candidatus Obscuribacterales bacterium]|nr:hypothetical protein [Candidatus Obscuribacterales bacterium]
MSDDESKKDDFTAEVVVPGLLNEYFRANFERIDSANSDFCKTIEQRRLSKYLARKLNIPKSRLETILRNLVDEKN